MITAKQLFYKLVEKAEVTTYTEMMIEFAKYHVTEALKKASEKASLKCGEYSSDDFYIDTDSILNAYPLSNIK